MVASDGSAKALTTIDWAIHFLINGILNLPYDLWEACLQTLVSGKQNTQCTNSPASSDQASPNDVAYASL